jgi:2'-5' RNA ligase
LTHDTARLFVALWPGENVREQIAGHAAQWSWPSVARRYAPADWHVTLHFIGAFDKSRLTELQSALQTPFKAFTLRLDEPLVWPHGLAVMCARETPHALRELHEQLRLALEGLGIATDTRPYTPHLTLARQAQASHPPAGPENIEWNVHGYALVESTGNPKARYKILRQYP